MFTDNCMTFTKQNMTAAWNITVILKIYCNVSGQLVNYHKSVVQFQIETEKAEAWLDILQVLILNSTGAY